MKNINRMYDIKSFVAVYEHSFDGGYTYLGENHDFWEMAFVSRGTVEVTCDASVYTLSTGDMIFYPPLCFHNINRVGSRGARLLNLSFNIEGELPHELYGNVFSLTDSECEGFERTFEMIRSFFRSEGESKAMGQLAVDRLSVLLSELSLEHNIEERAVSSQSAFEYRRLVSTMREHVFDNLTLSDIAHQNNVSVSYVKLLFSRYVGASPKSFYSQLRLNTAKELLRDGMSVADVSAKMNFTSHNYFARYFKKSTGMTPTEYKRALQQ